MLIDPITFFWGASGFVALEVWSAYKQDHPQRRHRRLSFWVKRLLMCLVAGQVTSAMMQPLGIASDYIPALAMAIGFSASALPTLMSLVLRGYINLLDRAPDGGSPRDADIAKILNPPPDIRRSQDPPILPPHKDEPAEKYEHHPVNRN